MEILNNIWNILITENYTYAFICVLPLYFVETYLYMKIFTITLNINFSKNQKIMYIISISLILIFSNTFIKQPFNLFVNYLFTFLLLFFIYKINFLNSTLSIVIPFAIFGIVNTLIINPYLTIFKLDSNTINSIPIYKIIYLFLVYSIVYLIIFVLKHIKPFINFNLNYTYDKTTKLLVFANLILGIITLFIQAIITYYYIDIFPLLITSLNLILLTSYFILSFYSLIKTIKLYTTTKSLETAENYNQSLTILYENVNVFKHDFDNMIDVIGGYINLNDMNGLKKYYYDLRNDCLEVKNIELLNPNIINNPGIYNLIISKYKKASEKNIKTDFEFFFDFNKLKIPVYEFSKILGILLDNAIESAGESEEKEIKIIFRDSTKNKVQLVIIENTYKNKNIDINKIFLKRN